jgi:hypothetical protein
MSKDFHHTKTRMFATKLKLPVHGQGVFLFKANGTPTFTLVGSKKMHVTFTDTIKVKGPDGPLVDPQAKELSTAPGAYYWFSIDSQNENICGGVGEPRLETLTYKYLFTQSKPFLESIKHITYSGLKPIKILRDPITNIVPFLVVDTQHLTMDDVAQGHVMPVANLPATCQKLYNCISGPNFTLDSDFPFYKAIEYSLATPGLWCYETIKKKATEFNDKPNKAETYLRITLGQNNGESPGIPYVMEIWPPGHYSPIHSHAGAEAVIRVLEGGINVKLYPFLSGGIEPFGSADFVKGDVMWISPTLNQTHQLHNIGTKTCVTIQCYMYDGNNSKHYDYFDYLDNKGKIQQYTPDTDMDFVDFKQLMEEEWATKPWWR